MIFQPEEMIGIVDLRLLGYYKIKQGVLQQNLSKYYRFEKAVKLCEYFSNFVNSLKKERKKSLPEEKFQWLDPSEEWKYIMDKEIVDKYINLENSCLTKEERKEVMEILYKYRETFSLRDGIVTCPTIEVEIEATDKSPFFTRP